MKKAKSGETRRIRNIIPRYAFSTVLSRVAWRKSPKASIRKVRMHVRAFPFILIRKTPCSFSHGPIISSFSFVSPKALISGKEYGNPLFRWNFCFLGFKNKIAKGCWGCIVLSNFSSVKPIVYKYSYAGEFGDLWIDGMFIFAPVYEYDWQLWNSASVVRHSTYFS